MQGRVLTLPKPDFVEQNPKHPALREGQWPSPTVSFIEIVGEGQCPSRNRKHSEQN